MSIYFNIYFWFSTDRPALIDPHGMHGGSAPNKSGTSSTLAGLLDPTAITPSSSSSRSSLLVIDLKNNRRIQKFLIAINVCYMICIGPIMGLRWVPQLILINSSQIINSILLYLPTMSQKLRST